jgi:hypothetical protein
MNPPLHVEAAVQVMRDWIRGQQAAADLDDAMAIVTEWVEARERLNEAIRYEH